MSQDFASAGLTAGQLNAVVDKLGGMEGVNRFLRGELTVSESAGGWREENGVIFFSVKSDGTTGPEWIKRLEKKGFHIGSYARSLLLSPDFKPTSGVTTELAVLKGKVFEDKDRATGSIRAEADRRKLVKVHAEVACLIREKFLDEDIEAMGFWWIVAMHEPIKDSDGVPSLLGADRSDDGCWLSADWVKPGNRWNRDNGFAFAVSQVSP